MAILDNGDCHRSSNRSHKGDTQDDIDCDGGCMPAYLWCAFDVSIVGRRGLIPRQTLAELYSSHQFECQVEQPDGSEDSSSQHTDLIMMVKVIQQGLRCRTGVGDSLRPFITQMPGERCQWGACCAGQISHTSFNSGTVPAAALTTGRQRRLATSWDETSCSSIGTFASLSNCSLQPDQGWLSMTASPTT